VLTRYRTGRRCNTQYPNCSYGRQPCDPSQNPGTTNHTFQEFSTGYTGNLQLATLTRSAHGRLLWTNNNTSLSVVRVVGFRLHLTHFGETIVLSLVVVLLRNVGVIVAALNW
jgi:hypothetical protein